MRALADRELSDASAKGLSHEGKFEHAYAAARALATIVIRAAGYRVTSGAGGHYHTFVALGTADATTFAEYSTYLDRCRSKRNRMSYLQASVISDAEADELLRIVPEFANQVAAWLKLSHPDLID